MVNLGKSLACAVAILVPAAASADEELQKKLANPVADLVTVPIQYTGNFNTGPLEKTQHTLIVEPVYPVKLDSGWTLINRLIVPLLSNPALAPGQDRKDGLGDILYEGFFSPPSKPHEMIWGIGPALQMRTASDDRLGSGKWAAGPAAVALVQPGKWTAGALVTQLWSIGGDDNRPGISQFQLQPILSYRLSPENTIGYLGVINADWKQHRSGERWTVPLGLSYSILTKPAGMGPINYVFGAGVNVARPDNAASWFVRFQVNFIFPK